MSLLHNKKPRYNTCSVVFCLIVVTLMQKNNKLKTVN